MSDTTDGFICGVVVMVVLYMMFYIPSGPYFDFVLFVGIILIAMIVYNVYQKGMDEFGYTDADQYFRNGWQAGYADGQKSIYGAIKGAAFVFFCMGVIFMLRLFS